MDKRALFAPILHLLIGSALIVMAYGLTDLLRQVIHPKALFDIFGAFSIVYLPHGVLVLLTWVYGWRVVPLVLPASILSVWLLRGDAALQPAILILTLFKVLVAPLTFALFRLGGIDAHGERMALNWRVLFLIGLVQSVFSSQGRFWLDCCGELSADELLVAFAGSVIGDMVGLSIVLVGAMLFFRALRRG